MNRQNDPQEHQAANLLVDQQVNLLENLVASLLIYLQRNHLDAQRVYRVVIPPVNRQNDPQEHQAVNLLVDQHVNRLVSLLINLRVNLQVNHLDIPQVNHLVSLLNSRVWTLAANHLGILLLNRVVSQAVSRQDNQAQSLLVVLVLNRRLRLPRNQVEFQPVYHLCIRVGFPHHFRALCQVVSHLICLLTGLVGCPLKNLLVYLHVFLLQCHRINPQDSLLLIPQYHHPVVQAGFLLLSRVVNPQVNLLFLQLEIHQSYQPLIQVVNQVLFPVMHLHHVRAALRLVVLLLCQLPCPVRFHPLHRHQSHRHCHLENPAVSLHFNRPVFPRLAPLPNLLVYHQVNLPVTLPDNLHVDPLVVLLVNRVVVPVRSHQVHRRVFQQEYRLENQLQYRQIILLLSLLVILPAGQL